MKKEYLEFKKKVIKNVNDMYINAEHSKSKKSTTVPQHIYYVKPNKDVCKLQLPTLNELPDNLLKQILPKFIENTLQHVNAVMACFVTEAFVSSAKSELTDEHKEILRDDSVSNEKKSKILEEYHSKADKKERTLMNFLLSDQAKEAGLSESFITFEKKKQSNGYILIPDDKIDLDGDGKDVTGRFTGLM